jgi:hypothetical protein
MFLPEESSNPCYGMGFGVSLHHLIATVKVNSYPLGSFDNRMGDKDHQSEKEFWERRCGRGDVHRHPIVL